MDGRMVKGGRIDWKEGMKRMRKRRNERRKTVNVVRAGVYSLEVKIR